MKAERDEEERVQAERQTERRAEKKAERRAERFEGLCMDAEDSPYERQRSTWSRIDFDRPISAL